MKNNRLLGARHKIRGGSHRHNKKMKFNGLLCKEIGWRRIKSRSHLGKATKLKCIETQRADNRNLVNMKKTTVSNKLWKLFRISFKVLTCKKWWFTGHNNLKNQPLGVLLPTKDLATVMLQILLQILSLCKLSNEQNQSKRLKPTWWSSIWRETNSRMNLPKCLKTLRREPR